MIYRRTSNADLSAAVTPAGAVILLTLLGPEEEARKRLARSLPPVMLREFEDTMRRLRAARANFEPDSVPGNIRAEIGTEAAESIPSGLVGGRLNSREAAGLLGVSTRRVRQLAAAGHIDAQRVGSQFTREAVHTYTNLRRAA
ncbi:hypothetical protein BRM1_09890 [Brevibacterium sp. BRM-1]|uniref:hypothetical protein n=1 Tax=Brevibacterium sp. BRM-1 TaxID=2999062 RepID=UPI002282E051|nr:hypothetical protein [Brevibacterium sp. BRM-1]WAL39575.1 hypothetical protein BRM1_09890 [Brevibacterium sp. BRM-1]